MTLPLGFVVHFINYCYFLETKASIEFTTSSNTDDDDTNSAEVITLHSGYNKVDVIENESLEAIITHILYEKDYLLLK